MAYRNLKERIKDIGRGEFCNKRVFACVFLVFCFVLKSGRDVGMLIKGRKETSREGNLDILKRERN